MSKPDSAPWTDGRSNALLYFVGIVYLPFAVVGYFFWMLKELALFCKEAWAELESRKATAKDKLPEEPKW